LEFYGRYAIHETELVLFLVMLVWGGAGIWRFGGMRYLWVAALGATGMILTKETYIIHFTAFALAVPCLWILEKILPGGSDTFPRAQNAHYSTRELCTAGAVCALLIIFFYSGNFLDFSLLKGLYLTFGEWVKTGQGGKSGHEKIAYDIVLTTFHVMSGGKLVAHPITVNYYWLALLCRYEWPAVAGMYLSLFYIWPKSSRFIRYLMIYGWGVFTAYSIVQYKTPWCVITIMWPFLFVFGDFFAGLLDVKDSRPFATMTSALLLAVSLGMSTRLSFFHYTDENEDYVYVQTLPDIYKLTDPLFKLVAQDPVNYHLKGVIIMDSTHPLPWVLGDFTNLAYSIPDAGDMDAAFLLVDGEHQEEVEKRLNENYFTDDFHLRASLSPVKLFLNYNKFHDLFPGRKPEFNQGVPVPAPADPDDSKDDTP
jgi:hypothetical protein